MKINDFITELKMEIPMDGNMGIPRSKMPQIKSKDYPEFVDYLAANGATFSKESVPARSLTPVQNEFSKDGVMRAMQKELSGVGDKPLIVSSDNYIMDGHHRWLVAVNGGKGGVLNVFRVSLPGRELLDLLLKFPKVYFKNITNEAGVGKITKQNTTPDVKPGETERQAKKFFGGNGKPKPLGVKGATPNQAFNLGMTEGYKLQLERDTDMMVLHITDTATGKRTEVRGKAGYETNRYDPDDKLHQLLDKVGRSASVSDMMNGEVVTINPNHPQGASAKTATDTAFNESLDNPYPYKFTGPNTNNTYFAKAQTPNGELVMEFDGGYDDFSIDFSVGNAMGKTDAGDQFRVFATVVAMMNKWISVVGIEHVEAFDFAANKEEHAADGRARLYARFAKKLAAQLGWSLQQSSTGNDSTEFFSLINPKATPRPEGYFDAIDDGKLGPNGEIPAQYNENIRENISVTGTARGKSARKKNLRPGSEEWFKHWFSLPLMKRESFEEAKKELQDHLTNLIEATIMDSEVIAEEAIDVTGIITPAIKKLDSVFKQNKYEMRIVGGAVRDIVLGKSPKDIDMASDATPDEMIAMLDKAGIKHIPTGIAHGTLTAVVDGEDFEITTLRADSNTDGRHADVSFVRSWEEDAKRRDLTYNAMSMDIAGEIYDYHSGMDDLQDKVSRFVGDPAERMQEDYLRILRYFRFQARMDSPAWDKDTLTAVADNAAGLKKISAERVWMEMEKILGGSNVANVLQSIDKTGVAGVIGLKVENLNLVTDNTDPIIQLAKIGNQPEIAKRWKMDNVRANMLEFLVTHKDHTLDKKAIEDMIADGVDKDKIVALATLQGKSDMAGHVAKASVPEFPVTGKDLIATGMKPGIELGKRLAQLKAKWKDSNFTATKGDLLGESLSEALGEIGENSEIFVDMDGVLADFFGEWTKSQGVDDWKEIKNPEQAIGDIKNIDDFWLNLPVLPKARNLLELIKQVKGKYKICTSPLADDPRSEPHKREWVKKNLAFFPPEEVIVTHNKPQFAKQKDGTSNILIDDFGKNIDAWEAAGGIGFKYKDYKFQRTAKDIKQHMQEPVEENFKDGKVKGKSRPGRVKRSGASCDGSVTELRKKAKNASGDKAKMYHWCANMKSGKK
tara:strand:+ start:2092 stop:5484 length:3393 start_codon:yes stop_codon:yes gene_type:complete